MDIDEIYIVDFQMEIGKQVLIWIPSTHFEMNQHKLAQKNSSTTEMRWVQSV